MKIHWKFLFMFAILILMIGFVLYSNKREKDTQRIQLISILSNAVELSSGDKTQTVNFSKIAPFSWEKVYFFRPYTSHKRIDSILGRFWLTSRFTHIETSDRITLIVFVHNQSVIQFIEFPRRQGDFSTLDNDMGYLREDAVFSADDKGKLHWISP